LLSLTRPNGTADGRNSLSSNAMLYLCAVAAAVPSYVVV
jgi:hypothetical protein